MVLSAIIQDYKSVKEKKKLYRWVCVTFSYARMYRNVYFCNVHHQGMSYRMKSQLWVCVRMRFFLFFCVLPISRCLKVCTGEMFAGHAEKVPYLFLVSYFGFVNIHVDQSDSRCGIWSHCSTNQWIWRRAAFKAVRSVLCVRTLLWVDHNTEKSAPQSECVFLIDQLQWDRRTVRQTEAEQQLYVTDSGFQWRHFVWVVSRRAGRFKDIPLSSSPSLKKKKEETSPSHLHPHFYPPPSLFLLSALKIHPSLI